MDADPFLDFASSIRFALTARQVPGGVEIVLDLFRGAAPALTRTIAAVRAEEAAPLMATCRRHLERRGVHAVTQGADVVATDPAWTAPMATFGWLFAG